MSLGCVTQVGASAPATVSVNVLSATRSTTSIVPPVTGSISLCAVNTRTVNFEVTFSLTSNGTPCREVTAFGIPSTRPFLRHCIPSGSSPATIM